MFNSKLTQSILISIAKNNINIFRAASTKAKPINMTAYIGTHDSVFHCDDVTACYMLKQLKRFKNHDIVRTRDPDILAKAEIIVDVGSELNIDKLRLDHHQRSFNHTINDYHPNIKPTNKKNPPRLSSSGLVYAIFGKQLLVEKLLPEKNYDSLADEEKKMIDSIYEKAYVEFFEEIDAIDNGVELVSGEDFEYNYYINSGLSSRVGRLNPIGFDATPELRLSQFKKAMDMVGLELSEGIEYLGKVWWPRRQQFREFVLKRKDIDPSGQIVLIEAESLVGWKSALVELEEELGIVDELKYIIYCDGSQTSPWRAIAVPINVKSFLCRVPLKDEWRGKRDEELQASSGISDATFVHATGFTGGAKSLAGIKAMVRRTLNLE